MEARYGSGSAEVRIDDCRNRGPICFEAMMRLLCANSGHVWTPKTTLIFLAIGARSTDLRPERTRMVSPLR